jgi:hypothetical protein
MMRCGGGVATSINPDQPTRGKCRVHLAGLTENMTINVVVPRNDGGVQEAALLRPIRRGRLASWGRYDSHTSPALAASFCWASVRFLHVVRVAVLYLSPLVPSEGC